MKIAVFCSASEDLSPMLLAGALEVGETLAFDGHEVIYGGASTGCMGALAEGVLGRGGRLIGILPEIESIAGKVQRGLTSQHIVPTLSVRKEKMIALADAFLVFPGGLGTLDEALEVLALKSLGTLQKQVVFYNFLGIWTPFLESLTLLAEQRLIRGPLKDMLQVLDKPSELSENFKHAL